MFEGPPSSQQDEPLSMHCLPGPRPLNPERLACTDPSLEAAALVLPACTNGRLGEIRYLMGSYKPSGSGRCMLSSIFISAKLVLD